MKIFAIGDIAHPGGGPHHTRMVLKELVELGNEVILYTPLSLLKWSLNDIGKESVMSSFKNLERSGVNIHDSVYKIIETFEADKQPEVYHNRNFIHRSFNFVKGMLKSKSYESSEDLYHAKKDLDNIQNYDIVYDTDAPFPSLLVSSYIAKRDKKPLIKILQTNPYFTLQQIVKLTRIYSSAENSYLDRIKSILIRATLEYKVNKDIRLYYLEVIKQGILKGLGSVSYAPIYESNLEKITRTYNIKLNVLKIGNAFDKNLMRFRRTRNKENNCVFFTRLVPEKGVYELPKIADKTECETIYVAGKTLSEKVKSALNTSQKIQYLGYLPYDKHDKLYDYVSRAKALIYPSHIDSFSLVVLESLALGTTVVAYNIPAIRFVYGDLKPVKKVKEFDINSMAKEVNKVLRMSDEEYEAEHEDEKIRKFLVLHSDWKNVALEIYEFMKEVINRT